MKPHHPAQFCRRVVADLRAEGRPLAGHEDDLVQIGLIYLWQQERVDLPVSYYYTAIRFRMLTYLRKQARCATVPRPGWARPNGGCDPALRAELHDLRDAALRFLLDEGTSPEQGGRDFAVASLVLEGHDYAEVAERCPWLANPDSVQKALVRIVERLREHFDADVQAPIEPAHRTAAGASARTFDRRDYQRRYYEEHRAERIAAATTAKRRRREVQAAPEQPVREVLHAALLALGYVRYGLADSGASAYYVHPDGFRVRVSDHDPHSAETSERVRTGRMCLVRVDQIADPQSAIAAIEAARQSQSLESS